MDAMLEETKQTREQLARVNHQLALMESQDLSTREKLARVNHQLTLMESQDLLSIRSPNADFSAIEGPIIHTYNEHSHSLGKAFDTVADNIDDKDDGKGNDSSVLMFKATAMTIQAIGKRVIVADDHDDDDNDNDDDLDDNDDDLNDNDDDKGDESSVLLFKATPMTIEAIGKRVKKSKKQATWSFREGQGADSVLHFVTMIWSKSSRRVQIHMDGTEVVSKKVATIPDKYFIYKWTTEDGLRMQVIACRSNSESTLSLSKHDLTVNEKRFAKLPKLAHTMKMH